MTGGHRDREKLCGRQTLTPPMAISDGWNAQLRLAAVQFLSADP